MRMRALSITEHAPQPVVLDVAAAQHCHRLAARLGAPRLQRRDRDRTARLRHDLEAVEQIAHRRRELGILDGDHLVDVRRVVREGDRADLRGEQPVRHSTRMVEPHGRTRSPRACELGGTRGFHADHARIRREKLHCRGDAGAQPAAAHRHQHGAHVRKILHDLESRGSLPRDDARVIVRRHEHAAGLLRELLRPHHAIGGGGARELHLAAEPLDTGALDRGDGRGHDERRVDAEDAGRKGDGLRVITGRWRDDATRTGVRREPREKDVRTAELDRAAAQQTRRRPDLVQRDQGSRVRRRGRIRGRGRGHLLYPSSSSSGDTATGSSNPSSPPSSSSITTRATSHTMSPSSRFTSLTPCVFRPLTRIPFTGIRITIPCFVMSISSSSGRTSFSATTSPVFSVRLSVRIPLPPRFWTRYSSMGEHFPIPLAVTTSSVASRLITTIPFTSSPSESSTPFTPVVSRPISRTSFSWKRIERPYFVASTMSLLPSVICTSMS